MARLDRTKGSRQRYEWLVERVKHQTKSPNQPCDEWGFAKVNKGKNGKGHGVVVMPNGDHELVHRVAFMLVHGHWPEPCCIHDCDNPPCFLVSHLREGTQLDNIADMHSKNRQRGGSMPGETHPGAILSNDQADEIRRDYIKKYGELTRLGKKYGVSPSTIFDIVNGRSRTHGKKNG